MGVMWLAFSSFFTKIRLIPALNVGDLCIAVLIISIKTLPVDGLFPPAYEVVVGLTKMATAEEAAMGREWRGVRCLEDEVVRAVNHTRFAPCGGTPEKEDHVLAMAVDSLDDGVGEGLPAESTVAGSPASGDGECCVEEEDALLSPGEKMAVG